MTSAKVLSDLIAEFEESLSSWKGKPNVLLPTAPQFYQMGLVLSNVIDNNQSQDNIEQEGDVVHVYRTLLDGFPVSHLRAVLEDLHEAFGKTLEMFVDENNHDYDDTVDVQMAVQSLHGLYGTNARALLVAASGHPTAGWSLSKLQLLDATYDKLNRCLHHNSTANEGENQTDRATTISKTQEHLLVIIASLLEEPTIDFEELLPAINHLQERKNKDEKSTWEQLVKYKATYAPGWKEAMVGRYTEVAHKGYLLSMFTSVEEEEEPASMTFPTEDSRTKQSNTTNTKKAKASSPQDTIQRLVQQVQSVFPHLGEGYVETALSQYRGDVEQTMSALVEGQSNPASLPIVLQRLDPKLPARWKGPTSKQSKEDDEEARRITLQAVQTMEQQQEAEARALQAMLAPTHDEYNDDYDDQYDDIDGGMSADTGLYDDYDTVRTYNKMMKQVEEEQAFWADNRNDNKSNRKAKNSKNKVGSDDGDGEKKYRGPDKIKGGRIPKPISTTDQDASEEIADGDSHEGEGGQGQGKKGGPGRGGQSGRGGAGRSGRGAGGGTGTAPGRGAARHKQNKLASRQKKQRQAAAKKTG